MNVLFAINTIRHKGSVCNVHYFDMKVLFTMNTIRHEGSVCNEHYYT